MTTAILWCKGGDSSGKICERPHGSLEMKPTVFGFIQDTFAHPRRNIYVADTAR